MRLFRACPAFWLFAGTSAALCGFWVLETDLQANDEPKQLNAISHGLVSQEHDNSVHGNFGRAKMRPLRVLQASHTMPAFDGHPSGISATLYGLLVQDLYSVPNTICLSPNAEQRASW